MVIIRIFIQCILCAKYFSDFNLFIRQNILMRTAVITLSHKSRMLPKGLEMKRQAQGHATRGSGAMIDLYYNFRGVLFSFVIQFQLIEVSSTFP